MKAILRVLLVLVFLAAVGFGVYYYRGYQKLLKNPQAANDQEAAQLQATVGKLMVLPNETPSTATVLDKEKVKDQPFFANAENGDKVLIYTNAKKAVLYRPSTGKIIEVMPISLDPNASGTGASTKVALLNGTNTDGLTTTAETTIMNKVTGLAITTKEKAAKNTYTADLVVDVSGTKSDQAKAIADALGGTVGSLPAGETAPTGVDIVVIVAK